MRKTEESWDTAYRCCELSVPSYRGQCLFFHGFLTIACISSVTYSRTQEEKNDSNSFIRIEDDRLPRGSYVLDKLESRSMISWKYNLRSQRWCVDNEPLQYRILYIHSYAEFNTVCHRRDNLLPSRHAC